jgi:opacity protein-like surface antigen
MRVGKLGKIALACAALGALQAAEAAGERWYIGAGAGRSTTDAELAEGRRPPVPVVPQSSRNAFDRSDAMARIFAGYRFSPHVAIEAGYADYGSTRVETSFTAQRSGTLLEAGTMSATRDVRAFGIDLVGRLPVFDRFAILGRAGWASVKADAEVATNLESTILAGPFFSDGGSGLSRSASSRNDTVKLGAGLEWSPLDTLGVRLEWERLDRTGKPFPAFGTDFRGLPLVATDAATGEASLDAWSVSILWRF